ncbi:hypothetical protein HO133_000854 [Letharia lupina]|uniref:F-box domain-containing protein n=1 Tax=Letharia lupina TaxID=560253 RepID=A0A8H6CG83_9LECA|nr:uncharacterized protein HO133_000854 [Letharia lupina]KAF6222805.1 hypothetical protein HO133_000854 [Letharia lupina]
MFSRRRGATSSDKKPRKEKPTAGAHELFLEYEGFLAPSKPPPGTPSALLPTPSTPLTYGEHSGHRLKLSEDTLRSSTASHGKPRKSFSGFADANDELRSRPKRTPSQRTKSFLSFGKTAYGEPSHNMHNFSRPGPNYIVEKEALAQSKTSGWLRRCMSTSLKHRPSTPSSSMTPPPPYDGSLVFEDGDFTALPAMPGCAIELEPSKPSLNLASGAAARAAAAAQNEILDSMRNITLAEPHLTRDSESGVGIEVRDGGETMAEFDFDIPVVRQDPLSALPQELVGHILSYLDASSLLNAELVSHDWHQSASSRHVWKDVFHSEFQDISQRNTTMAGSGLGPGLGKVFSCQEWKSMWRARKALQQRWNDGYAAAIYLEGHTDSVYCVQFDENKILTGSRDRTIRIWDARTYECIKVLGVPSRGAGSAVPPLPADVADRGQRPFAKVFSSQSIVGPERTAPWLFMYHNGSILCLQYDDKIMITGSSDCTLIIWDIKAGYRPMRRLREHTAGVLDVCFDEKHIVSCSKDATVCLWDRSTGELMKKLSGHRGPVNAVQLRGNLVVSASGDGIAKLWNLTSGLCIKEFPSKDRGMACVEFSPDSRTILAGGNDQVIYQFDTSTGELVREMKGHEGLVRSLHLDSASGRVVSGSYDTSVKAYDMRSGEMIVNFTKWTSSWILSAKADYRRIIATSQDSRAVIMDFGYRLPGIESLEA